jgi:hypothetical protein
MMVFPIRVQRAINARRYFQRWRSTGSANSTVMAAPCTSADVYFNAAHFRDAYSSSLPRI